MKTFLNALISYNVLLFLVAGSEFPGKVQGVPKKIIHSGNRNNSAVFKAIDLQLQDLFFTFTEQSLKNGQKWPKMAKNQLAMALVGGFLDFLVYSETIEITLRNQLDTIVAYIFQNKYMENICSKGVKQGC